MPTLGLGLAAVGRPAYITGGRAADLPDRSPDALRRRCHDLLDLACRLGVRHIDVARSYGRSEEFVADWLRERPEVPRDLFVASKWGYTYTGGWSLTADKHEVKDHSLAAFLRQREETRALLGDRLDIYRIHSLTPDSPALTDTALHRALAELAAEGVRIGISTSGPRQADALRAALEVTVDGAPLFSSVQSTWNPLEPSVAPALAEAHAAGWLVVVKEGVANGRLVGAEAPETLRRIAAELDAGTDAVALAAAFHQPWTDVVLSGAATETQLTSNATAASLTLTERHLAALAELAEPAETYWRTRSSRAWS
ncbi:aldo/keto reductase [Streptomyces sp. LX-29]|uniref:aldo/keto reductase n=1 Tax=Streptomyces sp. LX-29 TaxID=2900152 RepID=UPI00240E59D4|nr:aldo/keto reductase [Streptomyces sp. LX-29]WFB10625.1 aldo/keto reductase [Streptomyces sp. LX-29]